MHNGPLFRIAFCKYASGNQIRTIEKEVTYKNTEIQGKFKSESPFSNGKIKTSNTSNKWITTVIYRFWMKEKRRTLIGQMNQIEEHH